MLGSRLPRVGLKNGPRVAKPDGGVADSLTVGRKTLENKPFSSKKESANRGGLGRTVADWIPLPCQNDIRGAKVRHAFSISSWRMPLGGQSALRQLASAVLAPACCSASLSSHSMLTAPSKPTRFSSMKISSSELASRAVPAVTKFQPLVQWPMLR